MTNVLGACVGLTASLRDRECWCPGEKKDFACIFCFNHLHVLSNHSVVSLCSIFLMLHDEATEPVKESWAEKNAAEIRVDGSVLWRVWHDVCFWYEKKWFSNAIGTFFGGPQENHGKPITSKRNSRRSNSCRRSIKIELHTGALNTLIEEDWDCGENLNVAVAPELQGFLQPAWNKHNDFFYHSLKWPIANLLFLCCWRHFESALSC